MILIDAIFINEGGGKVLLDYLFEKLSILDNCKITFLIDKRIESEYKSKYNNNVTILFLKNFTERNKFLKKNKSTFLKILCFGNIPPNIRMDGKVYTYFHQPMYLNVPKNFSFVEKLKFVVKIFVLKRFLKNADFWLVQNDFIKTNFQKKFNVNKNVVNKLPFYPPLDNIKNRYNRVSNSFIYVSNATPHKNHKNLIDGFCKFYDRYGLGELILTVSENYKEIFAYCNLKIAQGYPIINIGFVERNKLAEYYGKASFLVFPSLEESFGLGIVEAIDCGCNVIGADLPYLYEVCKPSIVFDPLNVDSIYSSLCNSIKDNYPQTTKVISNEISTLINLFK